MNDSLNIRVLAYCAVLFSAVLLKAQPIAEISFEPGADGKAAFPGGIKISECTKVVTSDAHGDKSSLWIDLAKGGGSIAVPLSVEKGKLYRIAFYYKLSYPKGEDVFKICQSKEAGGPVRIWVDWKPELARRNCPFFGYAYNWALAESYVYAIENGEVTVSISFSRLGGVLEGWLDDVVIEEVAREYHPPEELILDSDMENGAYPFLAGYGARQALSEGTAWLAVDHTEFLKGRSSIRMVNVGFSSNELLFRAGDTYKISFWMKCTKPETLVQATIGPAFASLPVQPKGHYYHGIYFVGSVEWKKFSFCLKIPANGENNYYGEWTAWVLNLNAKSLSWVDILSVRRLPGRYGDDG